MSDPVHSAFPWVAKDGHIFSADGEEIGVVYRTEAWSSGEKVEHEDQANLCLMIAAPELLAALLDVRNLIAEAASVGFDYKNGDWAERLFFSQQKTSSAIAKARGT